MTTKWRKTPLKCKWWLDEKKIVTYKHPDERAHQHIDKESETGFLCEGPLLSKKEADNLT